MSPNVSESGFLLTKCYFLQMSFQGNFMLTFHAFAY